MPDHTQTHLILAINKLATMVSLCAGSIKAPEYIGQFDAARREFRDHLQAAIDAAPVAAPSRPTEHDLS